MQIIDTPHQFKTYVSFTGFTFYIAVRCGFDKRFYIWQVFWMHVIITHVYVCPKQVVLREKWQFSLLLKIRQTQVLAGDDMATTITIDYNFWFPWSLSPAECSTAFACNNPSGSVTEIITTKHKTKSYTLTWRIWTFCPQLPQPRFRARDLHALLWHWYIMHNFWVDVNKKYRYYVSAD